MSKKTPTNPYIKSPLNYMGGKHKLLPALTPLFPPAPTDIFVDLFAGGFNVGVNACADTIICNDKLTQLTQILEMFHTTPTETLLAEIEHTIRTYNLTQTNRDGYNALRTHYNNNPTPLELYTLICYSFNHQIRFNRKNEFNIPFGKNRSSFNETMKTNLLAFTAKLKTQNIVFMNKDFTDLPTTTLTPDSFVYADPPYLISDGSYNDGKTGVGGGWGIEEEKKLLSFLTNLDRNNIRFGLSNVLQHKGQTNTLLTEWARNYTTHHLDKNYANSNYHIKDRTATTVEVYVTNYPPPAT